MKEKSKYTRYEKTRIVSSRALQIAQGSPVLISTPRNVIDPTEIAKLEWEAGVIPIDIKPKKIQAAEQPDKPAKHAKDKKVEKPAAKKIVKSSKKK
jgi:DNA-directed RNA polymerase subunit K/omega